MALIQNYYPSNAHYGINLLFCGKENCSPGHTFGPAKRTNYLLHYVLSGQGSYRVGGHLYPLKSGQCFIIYPGDIISYEAHKKDPWTYMWIGFDGNDSDQILHHLGVSQRHHLCSSRDPKLTHHVFNDMLSHDPSYLSNPVKRLASITTLFSSLSAEHVLFDKHKAKTIDQALAFIHHNYQYDVKVSHLASSVNLERTWLYRLFQKEMATSPKAYLTQYRLKKAKEYLGSSELSLTEIALSCGFPSSSAFHKHFKKAFGLTPKAYREEVSSMSNY